MDMYQELGALSDVQIESLFDEMQKVHFDIRSEQIHE